MRRSHVLLRVGALGLGAVMALTPMTVASAKTKTGVNRGSSFCKLLISQESASEKYATKIEGAIESNNLASAKSVLLAEFNFVTGYVTKSIAVSGIPGNVQSALKYFLSVYNKEKPAIQRAESLPQLESALTTLSKVPKFTSASKTINAYVSNQCGSLTPTTTTT